jgi:aldose 1-epimerase
MSSPLTPSGQQVKLVHGGQVATIVEVGAALRSYRVGGEEVLGFGLHEMSSSGRGQPLIPWPNRLAGGSYDFAGTAHHLPLTEPDRGNAIHGLVRWANWAVAEQGHRHVVMAHRLHPQPGYPFVLDLRLRYGIGDDGLTVELTATNRGDGPCPFGAGFHPYLRIGDGGIDRLVLEAPAAAWYQADLQGIPTARRAVEGTPYDLRHPKPIGDLRLDTAFTDTGGPPAVVELTDPDCGRHLRLWMGPGYGYYMLFTGDAVADAGRRRHGLAVEPMTCAPNAFRTGDGLWTLEPGEARQASWGITPIGFDR